MAFIFVFEEAEITVDYEEMIGSPVEKFDGNKRFSATRRLRCVYQDRLILAKELLGQVSGSVVRNRRSAARYPHNDKAYCMSVSIAPMAGDSTNITPLNDDTRNGTYEYAQLTVEYAVPEFNPGTSSSPQETFQTETLSPTVEIQTIPGGTLYWDAAGTDEPISENDMPGRRIVLINWEFSVEEQDDFPDEIFTLIAKVNASPVVSRRLGKTFAAETLLFSPPRLSRQYTTNSEEAWKIDYTFIYNPLGWNNVSKTGSAETAPQAVYKAAVVVGGNTVPGGVAKIYELGDFTAVIP